jgi:hypothetical protein
MDDFLVGLVALLIGAGVCFFGLRVWFVMLPIWGFFAGFFVGATAITAIFGDGFLSTVTGWVVGAVVGIGFALLAYLFWYAGAIIAAGSVGATAGSGLMQALGADADWLLFTVALIGAIVFAAAAFLLAIPIWTVVIGTAFGGATAAVAGAMLVFNQIDLDELRYGAAWAFIEESWFWLFAWIVVAALGMVFQMRQITGILLPADRWTRVEYGPPPTAAPA